MGGVPRPRLHDIDELLDVAEELVSGRDPAGLTLRALAQRGGVPIGSIYHAFGSKEDLLARLWLRAAGRLGAAQQEALDAGDRGDDPVAAVVAVALAPVTFGRRYPASAEVFFTRRREQLFATVSSPTVLDDLTATQQRFVARLRALARSMWGRDDRVAVDAVTACVVDVPGGVLGRHLREGRYPDPVLEARIVAAVRAILDVPLDPPPPRRGRPR